MSQTDTTITLETKWYSEPEIRIIRGTYRAMARVGSQQLSLRHIAKELEVSPALLVYHFGSRDRLLIETMHWALAGTVRRIKRQIQGIQDPEEALSILIDAIFVSPKENRDYHLIYMDLVQYAVRKESFTELTQLLREHVNDSYAAVISRGVQSGAFSVDDVDAAARTVRAIVEGGFLQWLQEDDWMDTHERLQRECDSSLRAFLAPTSK